MWLSQTSISSRIFIGLISANDTKFGGVADMIGSCFYTEGSGQVGEMGWLETHEIQHRQAWSSVLADEKACGDTG